MYFTRKDIWLLILSGISGFFIAKFLDPVWLLLLNIFSTQKIPFDVIGAITGLIAILVTTAIAVYLLSKLRKHHPKNTQLPEDYLDDLIEKLQNFKHRWNWGMPFWSRGYKKQILGRVISHKKIRKHATEIRKAARSLRDRVPTKNERLIQELNSLEPIVDTMIDFSSEIEEIFEMHNVSDTPIEKLQLLVVEGEDIRKRVSRHLDSFDKLRGTLPLVQLQSPHLIPENQNKVSYENILSDIQTPSEIEVGGFAFISATYQGSLEDGYLTCDIVDYSGDFNWCEDKTTIRNLDDNRQIGTLNFKDEIHTYRWEISPKRTLKKGKGKLIIGAYETKDYPQNGRMIEFRIAVDKVKREVLLC